MFRIDLFTQNNTPGINERSLRLAFGKYAIDVFVLRFSFAREPGSNSSMYDEAWLVVVAMRSMNTATKMLNCG